MGEKKETALTDPERMAGVWANFGERGRKIVEDFLERQAKDNGYQVTDPVVIGKAFLEMGAKMMADPAKLAQAQADFWRDYSQLWQEASRRMMGGEAAPVAEPEKGDRRFADEAWTEQAVFDFIKQSYLLASNWIRTTVKEVEGLDPETARKVDFYSRQFVDAMAPTNFALTNPKVLKATLETGGENLLKGLDNLLSDLEKGKGRLSISMTDLDAFTLGENVATTPGKVVFQNDLMQLIQYAPSTETVYEKPLLIVPPWINKYYVLDLKEKNSFIKWALDRGHSVFVISWVNPDETLSHKTFENYMFEGPLAAMDAIEKATGEREIDLLGYCIGGTLCACALAYLAAKGDPDWQGRVASATFLTTLIDFKNAGEISVFIDDEQLGLLQEHMNKKGYLEGAHMSTVFNLLRDQDLIWSFVVNNYLLGRDPLPFDLLYWNADTTRMPAMMHGFYLRNMYLDNKLIEPGALQIAGVPIDLGKIEVPVYVLATREDHIAPWTSTYAALNTYCGPMRFVLSASGHIAGVINPPNRNKYCHWTNSKKPKNPETWLKNAQRNDGSWWPDWEKWVKRRAGRKDVPAREREPGSGGLKAIEDAPGSYVKKRSSE